VAVSALSETMTLRNMRENGVRSLAITCGAVWCNHQAVLDVNTLLMMLWFQVSDHAWSARCVVPLVRMRGQTGMSVNWWLARCERG
jgi:hypothetical protein